MLAARLDDDDDVLFDGAVWQNDLQIENCHRADVSSSKRVGDMQLSSSHVISVAMMAWNGEHHAFVIGT